MNTAFYDKLKHSPIHNYAGIPGLTSWMIQASAEGQGCIRMFEMERHHEGFITPHSHRFDFDCFVLEGVVRNTVYHKNPSHVESTEYVETIMAYTGEPGKYTRSGTLKVYYRPVTLMYTKGERYGMQAKEIHSITFDKGTKVLFVEGPTTMKHNVILEPFHRGEHIQTLEVKDWMFSKS